MALLVQGMRAAIQGGALMPAESLAKQIEAQCLFCLPGCEGPLHTLALQVAAIEEALTDMVHQFAYESVKGGVPVISTGGLSALEHAFRVLGMDDPQAIKRGDAKESE